MVSISPRLRDSLDYEDPESLDPRLSTGFQAIDLEHYTYDERAHYPDIRPYGSNPERPSSRRKKLRNSNAAEDLEYAPPYEYVSPSCAPVSGRFDGVVERMSSQGLVSWQNGVNAFRRQSFTICANNKVPDH